MAVRFGGSRPLVVVAVGLADIALIAWAVGAHGSVAQDTLVGGSGQASPTPFASPTPSGSPVPPDPAATRRALPVAAGHGAALRTVDPGSCATGGAQIQWSSNGGGRWQGVDSPANLVLRVRLIGARHATLIGADDRCRLAQWSTTDAGKTWRRGSAADNWLLDPQQSAATLYAPSGKAPIPCAGSTFAVDLVGLSSDAAVVLCSGAAVFRTTDGAAHWQKLGSAPRGALALGAVGSDRALVLVRGNASCAGLAAVTISGGAATRTGCLAADSGSPGAAGLAMSSITDGVVSLGQHSAVTHDGGKSFA